MNLCVQPRQGCRRLAPRFTSGFFMSLRTRSADRCAGGVRTAGSLGEATDLARREPGKLQVLRAAFAAWEGRMEKPRWIRQDPATIDVCHYLRVDV